MHKLPTFAQWPSVGTMRVSYGSLPGRPCALAGQTMGTTWSAKMTLPGHLGETAVRQTVQAAYDAVVAQMSNWESTADIMRYNLAESGWVELPAELLEVVDYGLWLAHETDGAYDPTIGPLVQAWGFGPHQRAFEPPGAAAVQAARARCGYARVKREGTRAWQPGGIAWDLSSIAKGYGVDYCGRALIALGITDFLIEAGGEFSACGKRPDGLPWRVAVEWPDRRNDQSHGNEAHRQGALANAIGPHAAPPLGESHATPVRLDGLAIATSGDYRRFIEQAGRRYAHTIDPRTGRSVDNGVASVSVVHAGCMQADALATALTVLGLEAGMHFAQRHALAALFIVRTGNGFATHATPGFTALTQ